MIDISDRHRFLAPLIGLPWVANAKGPDAYDCFHLVQHVQKELFGVEMSDVEVPNEPSWFTVIDMIRAAPEFVNWREVYPAVGIHPADGTIVVMASHRLPAHIGVWLKPERSVLHVDRPVGVVLNGLVQLRTLGWNRLRFYERRGS